MNFYLTDQGLDGRTFTICAGGELDMYSAPALRDAIADAAGTGAAVVLVDLGEATFVDSTTIGVLVAAARTLREAGSRLSLRCVNRNVLRTFEIAGLERHMPISR